MVRSCTEYRESCLIVTGMKTVRLWLQNHLPAVDSATTATSPEPTANRMNNKKISPAITPTSVPEFVIPKRKEGVYYHVRTGSTRSEDSDLTELNNNGYKPRPYRKVYSLPSSMSQMGLELQCSAEISDPGYNAAVSMTHLRTKTSYGFPTVLEHPNTNRKESLLLGSGGADKIKLFNEMLRKERSWSEESFNFTVGSEGNGSISDVLGNSLPTTKLHERLYQRRRSSTCNLPSEDHEDNDSQTSSESVKYLTKVEAKKAAPLGEIKFSIDYNKRSQRLHLKVIRVENLISKSKETDCNPYVKCYLEPSKVAKQQTDVVRCNKNPSFNSLLVFKNVTADDLRNGCLRLRVCNKIGSGVSFNQKRSILGEVILPLNQINLDSGELRMWRDLERHKQCQIVGFLNVTFSIDTKEGQLYVTMVEAASLSLSSPPDSYVKVCVSQTRRSDVRKQTQVQRSTSNPVYNETFVFSISCGDEDIQSLSVDIKVMSKERMRTDAIIGEVKIDTSSSLSNQTQIEESYWDRVLNTPNKSLNQWAEVTSVNPL